MAWTRPGKEEKWTHVNNIPETERPWRLPKGEGLVLDRGEAIH